MNMPMSHSYSLPLVALSILVAMLASLTALDLAGRVQASAGRARALWIVGGATAMGIGVWSMHFVGMLSFEIGTPMAYEPGLVVLSVCVAIGASAFALWTAAHARATTARLAGAAVAMGAGIAGMHYIGMAAMSVHAQLTYDRLLLWASIGIAVGASFVALMLFRHLGADESRRTHLLRAAAAVVMGFAISGMHYTGMAAARFTMMSDSSTSPIQGLPPFALGVAVTLLGCLVIGMALTAAMIDRLIHARAIEAELLAAKEAAEQTSRAKSEFLSNMSHELRTPLNSVIGFANIVLKNKAKTLGEQDIAYLGRIVANGKHLLGLINGILDLSKIEAGRVELEVTPVQVDQLVRETVLELEGQMQGRAVTLIADVPLDVRELDTDGTKLKQVLINLVGNALKFTRQGSVTVRLIRDERTAMPTRIDVIDTGIGIPADRLTAIFEAFQQADSSTSRQYGGTGLGLTITRSLALVMGFDVRVASKEGVGSTFSVVLAPYESTDPQAVQRQEARRAAIAAEPAGETRPARVLVIDDDPDARMLQSQQLQELGCEVTTASSADEGLATARRARPDLVTLDVMMPRRSGVEAMHLFKTDTALRHIPVVLISTAAEEYRGRVLGAAECLDKPVTAEMLAGMLTRNLELVPDVAGILARVKSRQAVSARGDLSVEAARGARWTEAAVYGSVK